jgi:hypothetical protein
MSEIYTVISKEELVKFQQAAGKNHRPHVKPYNNSELYQARNCASLVSKIIELLSCESRDNKEAQDALSVASLLIETAGSKKLTRGVEHGSKSSCKS